MNTGFRWERRAFAEATETNSLLFIRAFVGPPRIGAALFLCGAKAPGVLSKDAGALYCLTAWTCVLL